MFIIFDFNFCESNYTHKASEGIISSKTTMAPNRNRAPDVVNIDLTDDDALSQVIRLKARAVVPKNRRERIVLALKHYKDRAKLTNKYAIVAPKVDEFGGDTDLDTSDLSPQDIREKIADAVLEQIKNKPNGKKSTSPSKTTKTNGKQVSPSPLRKKTKQHFAIDSPYAKKHLVKDMEEKM